MSVSKAVAVLQVGGIVAYPTEAVFGLGVNPDSPQALKKLCALKAREVEKGLLLVASNLSQVQPWVNEAALTPAHWAKVKASWPGHVTWLFPKSSRVHPFLSGEHPTIAIRVSSHPLVGALCDAYGGAIVSTSANVAAEPPATSTHTLSNPILEGIDYLLEGETGGASAPSTIKDVLTDKVFR